MKIYYGADLVNDCGGGECYSNKHYPERRRHGVPEIVKFITLLIQSTYMLIFAGKVVLKSIYRVIEYRTEDLAKY